MSTDHRNGFTQNFSNTDINLEQALTFTGCGWFHYLLLFGCIFIVFAHAFENGSAGFLIAATQCDFDMTPEQKGLLNSIVPIGIISSSYFWGLMADIKGRKFTLLITLFMDFLLAVASSFAPNYHTFIVIRFFNGFFICGPSTLMYTYVGEFHSSSTRPRAMIFLNMLAAVAHVCIPVMAYAIIPQNLNNDYIPFTYSTWRIFVIVCGLPSIFAFFFLFFFLPETPCFLVAQNRTKDALEILLTMYTMNNKIGDGDMKILKEKAEISDDTMKKMEYKSNRDLIKRIINNTLQLFTKKLVRFTLLVGFIQFTLFVCFCSFTAWIPEIFNILAHFYSQYPNRSLTTCQIIDISYHVNQHYNSTELLEEFNSTMSYYSNETVFNQSCKTDVDLSAFQNSFIISVCSVIGSFVAGCTVNFVGKKRMLCILLLTSGLCGIGFAFTTNSTQVLILFLIYILGSICTFIICSIVVDVYPTNLGATAVSLTLMLGRIGDAVGSLIFGSLIATNSSILFCTLGITVLGGEAVKMLNYEEVSLDDALTMTGHGKFHYILLIVNGFCVFAMSTELFTASYLLPAAQCDFQMTSQQKGLLNSVSYLGIVASCHMWGLIADMKGRKQALVWSLALDFICAAASSFAPNYYAFLIIRFFNGFFVFCAGAVVFAYTGEFHGPRTRSSAVILLLAFQCAALTLLPCTAWLIIPRKWSIPLPLFSYKSWRIFVFVCGLPSLICSICLQMFLPESPKFLLNQRKTKETLKILQHMYTMNTGKSPEYYQVKKLLCVNNESYNGSVITIKSKSLFFDAVNSIWINTTMLFRKKYILQTLLVCTLQFGIFFSYNSLLLWLPEVFHQMAEYTQENSGRQATVCVSLMFNENAKNISKTKGLNITDLYSIPQSNYINDSLNNSSDAVCDTDVNLETFRNLIIVGLLGMIVTLVSINIIKLGKKILMCTYLLISCACCLPLNFVPNPYGVTALSTIFISLVAVCSAFMSAFVVDIYPTNLRAMAVCLSIMCGRLAPVFGTVIISSLINVNCNIAFYLISLSVFICACLTCMLPSSGKTTNSQH